MHPSAPVCSLRPGPLRRVRGVVGWLLAVMLLGCGGGPEPATEAEPVAVTATLTVVVWSSELQQPVPAFGRLTSAADRGDGLLIDTSQDPSAGQVFPGLKPGRYRVEISNRRVGNRVTAVEGEGVVFLEPGSDERETVVVTDRDDLG